MDSAFEVQTWENMGETLWEEISTGSKEVSKFSTVWRLIYETLKEMRADKGAAASAFAALTLKRGSASATTMLFVGPNIPLAPVNKKKEGRGTTKTASESVVAGSQSKGKGLLPEFSSPPPEAPSPPPLGTPVTQTAEERERAQESKDSQIAELITKLEKLEATGLPPPPEPTAPNSANPFLSPPLNCAAPLGEVGGRASPDPGLRPRAHCAAAARTRWAGRSPPHR